MARYFSKHFYGLVVSTLLTIVLVTSQASARSAPESFADLAAKLLPAVVNISTTAISKRGSSKAPELPQFPPGSPFEDFRDFLDRNRPQQQRKSTSIGSGFIIDKKGIVITNNHVIQDADEITVILQNNETLKAEVIGRDPKTDIAVLRIKPKNDLPSVKLGDSDKIRVGDWVVAIGNPFCKGGSVTAGIVSARGRNINSGPYDDFIQTDASINKGNSGGPLFNMDGEVIGINTAIISPSGGSIGIGFSIPSRIANNIINQLVKYGKTRRGWLGVRIQIVTEEIAESLGLKKAEGALVASVTENSPAAKGNIKAGDVILKFNNQPVKEMRNLPKIVAETDIDKKVDVEVWRDGKKETTQVSVGELDEEQVANVSRKNLGEEGGKEEELKIASLGISVGRVTAGIRKRYNLKKQAKGVVVVGVEKEGAAAEKGIKAGDVIVEVSQNEVKSPKEVKKWIDEAKSSGRKSVLLLIEGQAGLRFVALRLNKK
ncbi:MAG: DegQ family serine endoprotease [Rhodospirillales bacterium]